MFFGWFLLGVSLLQYLEGIPDRQAVELLRYHAGWNFALNCQLGDEVFHPTTLVNFRQRLLAQLFALLQPRFRHPRPRSHPGLTPSFHPLPDAA